MEIYTVELYRKVRLACADGMSKRAAAAHFNIFRDTVEKALAFSAPPGYRRTAPIKRPKLDGFTEIIDAWLDGDKTVHRKQRHTAIGAMDVAVAQGTAFQHAELVEQEVRMVAGAIEMPDPGGTFLIAVGGADRAVHVLARRMAVV